MVVGWHFSGICVTTAAMRFRFLDCTLDTDRRQLTRAGKAVPLRPRVFELLALLIAERHRAVAKTEIFDRIWPKRVVSDATLVSCVKELRKAVGDRGDAQQVIETLHGHGFRFVAAVDADEGTHEPTAGVQPARTVPAVAPEREHKQASVLVCSLVDPENLAAQLSAESMDETMQRLLARAQLEVERFAGSICEWSGTGFVALFGAPAALEDHARAAVQAALRLLASQEHQSVRLKFGLDSGPVVAGPSAYTPAGETALRARRLCERAQTGTLLVSASTFRLVKGEVAAEPAVSMDDASTHRIHSILVRRAGVPRRTARGRSLFVGRDHEIYVLQERLARARAGTGQVVCITGEPGIGKSRLLDEFRAIHSVPQQTFCAQAQCLPHHATTPYWPIIALLRQLAALEDDDAPDRLTRKVEQLLERAGIAAADARALLMELLDVPVDDAPLAELGPQARRTRTFSYLTQLLLHRAAAQPCLVVIEDLHWIDATSEAFLTQLATRIAALRILLIVTSRPSYQPPWAGMSSATQIAVPRLSDEDSLRVVDSVPHSADLSQMSTREIVASAQGNPFFLEELTWTLSERDPSASGKAPVPGTVQAVLAARIDQLPLAAKRLLQIASIVGSRFDERLLRSVSEYEPEVFDTAMDLLQSREFLYQSAVVPASEFTFRHALTHEVAYHSLLSSVRSHHHQRIAEILERDFPETATSRPEVLAQHWGGAGRHDRAFAYWRRAGQRATERSANLEAAEHLRRALELNQRLEPTPDVRRDRLEVLLMLGAPLMASRGFAAAEVEEIYLRARELSEPLGTPHQRFTVAWGLWLHNLHRGRIDAAKALSQEILELAVEVDDPACQLQAHHAGWTTEQTHGDLETCLHHAEVGIRLYEPAKHHAQAYLYGMHDPGVCAHGTASLASWYLGLPDTALARALKTLDLARGLKHPYSELLALMNLTWIYCLRGEPDQARKHARMSIDLCTEQHFPNYLAYARFLHGWAFAIEGARRDGIEEMRTGLASYRALGLERHGAQLLTILAECLGEDGRLEEALEAIQEAHALLGQTAELRWEAEVHRVRGEVLLSRTPGDPGPAENAFSEALATARAQHARALELRAASSLARVWIRTGRGARAREMLGAIANAFLEGRATADFRKARALLAEGVRPE
jgi:DNA-binding winged helix-turn-helix (wHTH) protein/predicted ATPase